MAKVFVRVLFFLKKTPFLFTMLKTNDRNATHAPLGHPSTPGTYADNPLSPILHALHPSRPSPVI
jgi:hypothetical protein